MRKRILEILADGFEETEAIVPADFLRRLGCELVIAGMTSQKVKSSHSIVVEADTLLSSVNPSDFDALFLPGGMPGSKNLRENEKVLETVRKMYGEGKIISAICAAPTALGRAGILDGKRITCYPGSEQMIENVVYTAAMSERDGNIVTGKGPGASFAFAYELASALGMKAEADKLISVMFVRL